MGGRGSGPGPAGLPDEGGGEATGAGFWITGIGASAGGLKAIGDLLHPLPRDIDMAFVVVMHLDPTHESSLAELLGRVCELPVRQAVDGLELERGHVYVIPPNSAMTVRGGAVHLSPRAESQRPPRPIDLLLRSLAQEHDGRGIGVILSGTGSDGTLGLQAIEAEGGITFAQDDSAAHGDMPTSAVAAGCVGAVLPPEQIADELIRIARHPSPWLKPETAPEAAPENETEIAVGALVRRLSRSSGIQFLHYKQSTIRRRIQRRIVLLGLERVEEYLAYFDEHPEEAETLSREILIHVTGFFRDPEVFEALGERVFPDLVARRAPDDPIRIWVPGCATGEEVYSLAIGLLEFLERWSAIVPIKLFGTDVSEEAVALARSGRYPQRIAAEVSPERLRRYLVREGDGYVIAKAVRDLCIFARQDATRDPPFSNLDLISCRNLLIYLGPILQRRVLPVFHYALRDRGYLLLGTAETVGVNEDLFATVDERRSLYVRKSVPRRLPIDLTGYEPQSANSGTRGTLGHTGGMLDAQREADRIVLAKYAPPGVVIDEEFEILQFRGDTGAFLAPAPGAPSNNLLRMAREGLLPDLRGVIEEGKARGVPVRREGLRIRADGRELRANLELTPMRIPGTAERCFVILFEEVLEPPGAAEAPGPGTPQPAARPQEAVPGRVEQLERELVATRDFLRANVERLEAANEELRAANEEILSSNEELHSTNEELQTAKEELQASNEELLTINEELQHRNREVALLGDDLTNLLTSVRIPIVMMGRDLRIRRLTPSAGKILGISESDVGRSLLDVKPGVALPDLEGLLQEVLDTFSVVEREIQSEDGRWHSLRIRPYRTQDNKVDGAVLALADIDALKRLSQRLANARDFAESIVMSMQEPLLVVDADLSLRLANRAFHDTFGTTPDSIRDRRLGEGATARWITPELLARIAAVVDTGSGFDDLAVEGELPGRGTRHLRVSARTVRGGESQERRVLLAVVDVTDRERERAEKERLSHKLQEAQRLESLGVLAGGIAHDFNNILTAILGFADILQLELPPASPLGAYVERILASARRASELCSEMLAYSGRGRYQVTPTDLSSLVQHSASLLAAMVSKKAVVRYELARALPSVEVDVAQVGQVLANLVINASEALGEEGGHITVTTGVLDADEAYLEEALVGEVPPGSYVYLEVADDGKGMTAETQARIFDPFFTTKFTGRGLGLAAVLGIVRGHGGALTLDSAPGRGSTFRLLLPAAARPALESPPSADPAEASWRGEGTVLVVDDEREVRALLRAMLPGLGFRVEEARDGREGVEMLRAHPDRVDLVLLDLTMPTLAGAETFREMRALRPDLRIVLMSGYDEEEAVHGFPPSGLAGFLRKPFALTELKASLRRAFAG